MSKSYNGLLMKILFLLMTMIGIVTACRRTTDTSTKLETIKTFLETADFRRLRAESEKHLTEGKKVVFTVWQEKSEVLWEMAVGE